MEAKRIRDYDSQRSKIAEREEEKGYAEYIVIEWNEKKNCYVREHK